VTGEITVLYLDGDDTQLDLYARTASDGPEPIVPTTTTDVSIARTRLQSGTVDCLVTEQKLGSTTGVAFAESLRADGYDLPIVLHSWEVPESVLAGDERAVDAVVTKRTAPQGYRYLHRTVTQVLDSEPPTA
jgi:hypothetical protein